jgi:hypothetical protein
MLKKNNLLQIKENEIWKDIYNETIIAKKIAVPIVAISKKTFTLYMSVYIDSIEFKGKNALLYLQGKYIDTVSIEDILVLKSDWQI